MIVWTWIKRISCLIGKSLWFLIENYCFFGLIYLAVIITFMVLTIKTGDGMMLSGGFYVIVAIFLFHRFYVWVNTFSSPGRRSRCNERQREKYSKYAQLVRDCLIMK